MIYCSEAVEPLARQRAVCLVGKQESLLRLAVCSQRQRGAGSHFPKSALAALLAEEPLQPVPGTSQHPCKSQPRSPTQLLLFKHGVFHGLLWTGLCRPTKHLAVCGPGSCCSSLALVRCMCLVPKLLHHLPTPPQASPYPNCKLCAQGWGWRGTSSWPVFPFGCMKV